MPSSLASIATSVSPSGERPAIAAATSGALEASIGMIGRPTSSPIAARASSPSNAAPAAATVEPASIAARRTAASGHLGHLRDRLLRHGVERALAEVAGDDGAQPRLLRRGRAAEEVVDRPLARELRTRAGQLRHRLERLVDLEHVQRRLVGGVGQVGDTAPAQARAPLPQRTAEVGHDDLELARLHAAEQLGEQDDLGLAGPGGRDLLGGGDELGEQHASILPPATDSGATRWCGVTGAASLGQDGVVTDASLYTPRFNVMEADDVRPFVEAVATAQLVTVGEDGVPDATFLPVLWEGDRLVGHLARANAHWRRIVDGSPALAIVTGPDAYVSPSWYATKAEHGKVVPTWNYSVVHLRGRVVVHDDPAWVRVARHPADRSARVPARRAVGRQRRA